MEMQVFWYSLLHAVYNEVQHKKYANGTMGPLVTANIVPHFNIDVASCQLAYMQSMESTLGFNSEALHVNFYIKEDISSPANFSWASTGAVTTSQVTTSQVTTSHVTTGAPLITTGAPLITTGLTSSEGTTGASSVTTSQVTTGTTSSQITTGVPPSGITSTSSAA